MKDTMKRLTAGATRLLVLALGLGLVSTGWATDSLEETGETVPTTATLAFKNAKLGQVTADTLYGIMGGSWAGAVAGTAMTFNNFDRSSEASGTITCQAQVQHDTNVKGVLLTFTQDGDNVNVTKTGAKYIEDGTVGQSIAGGTDGYYDVSKLKLKFPTQVPLAVFDGASGGFKKTSINGVTFVANGNTVADDGSYVKISASVGALFKLSQGYNYVVGEFTVTNLNESAAANRVLALWSPAADGTGSTVGTYLTSGVVSVEGIWKSGAWNDLDGSLKSGVASSASRTFALATENSNYASTGTHLFELTGDNPGTAVYGGTGDMGLRGTQTYRTFAIGGPATGTLAAMTGLVITKVVIYASNDRQFASKAPTTIANVENPAAFYVGNGETINASTINAGVAASRSALVYTEAGATLNLDAALLCRARFSGSISGTPDYTDGLTLGSANDTVIVSNVSYPPAFKGSGTVSFPDKTLPTETSWMADSSAWTGTVILNNCGADVSGTGHGYLNLASYGNVNSFIRAPGYKGYTKTDLNCTATLVIESDETFTLTDGNSNTKPYFSKVKGSGTLAIAKGRTGTTQYVVGDLSLFTGTVTVSNDAPHSIVLGGTTGWSINTSYNQKLVIAGNATIAAGKTWTAPNGVVVNGTLTKTDSTATLSGTITGSGKIIYNDELPNSANFTANTWTGTVEVNGGSTTSAGIEAANAAQFMNAGSTFSVASGTVTLGTAAGLTGAVNVNSGATLQIVDNNATGISLAGTNNGTVNLQMASALTSLTLSDGIARGTVVYPSSLTTLNLTLKENLADDTEVVFSVGNGTTLTAATVTMYKPDGSTVNNTAAATVSADGHTVTVTYTPTVDGSAAWCAYEFETSDSTALKNTGSTTDPLSPDDVFSAATSVDGNGKLYTYSHPYRSISYPSDGNWSAMVRCTVPKLAEALVVAFGTNSGGIIGLAAGANPDTEMRVVQTTGNSHYVTNGVMPVLNGTTAQHVYVFTVASNQTVKVYCDNTLINTVVFPSRFSIGGGLQIGSIFAGIGSSGLKRCWYNDADYKTLSEADQQAARIDSMRLYQTTLGANAIAQLSEEFPAVMLFEATISGGDDNEWASLGWSGGNIINLNDSSKAIITVEDDATLTLPASITADELVFDIASGKTLTLVEADGGTTFTIGHPIEVNTGSVAFDVSSKTLDFAIGGTGYVFVDTGKTISVASGGSLSRISGSGTVTYASYGSLPSALAFGDWTGMVVLPSFVANGVNFDNYGNTGSTIALTGITSGWIDPDHSSASAKLRLDGAVNITAMSARTYTFAEIDGTGNLSFATATQPTAITITKVAEGYSGTISNTTERDVTITTLDRQVGTAVTPGSKLLTTSGSVTASALTVGGVEQSVTLCTESDGIYVAAASVQKGENPATYHTTVAAAMTEAGSGAATITLLANTSSDIALAVGQSLVTGVFSVGTVSTSATYYHVVNNAGVYTVVLDTHTITIPSVANTTVSVTYTSDGEAREATTAGAITVDAGTSLTATWTAASGYKITAGASQTINPVVAAQTLASPTVEAKGATVSGVTFNYGNNFATATVRATVSGDATTYTLTVDGTDYEGAVSGSTVTFSDVVTGRADAYDSFDYTISATDGTSSIVVSGGSGSAITADTTAWFSQSSANAGAPVGGSWTTAVNLSTPTNVTDNSFTATTMSTTSCVKVEFNVCFTATSDGDVSGEAQGALKLGEVNSEPTFMVLASDGTSWTAVSNAGLTPDPTATNKVVMTFDYANTTYSVSVDNLVLTNSSGSASFPLAKNNARGVQDIDFAGTGTLVSMKGDQLEGYMVKDNAGGWYATIEAATQAYNSANGPYTVLHDGTVPSGWKIDDDTKALIKAAVGMFFFAF